MRWIVLLLVPSAVHAADLTGTWSDSNDSEQAGIYRLLVIQHSDRIYFRYVSNSVHRCEVIGMADQRASQPHLYIFRNDDAHQTSPGYEGYGFEENEDCEVSFELDESTLKVRATGNCRSFCGLNGSIGGDLHQISSDKPSPESLVPP